MILSVPCPRMVLSFSSIFDKQGKLDIALDFYLII